MNYIIDEDDLEENPATRVPVCLCLDTSGSMHGSPIEALNKGVQAFFEAIKNDDVACASADICIITFGGNDAECIRDYANVSVVSDFPPLVADGCTPMAAAVKLAISKLVERKEEYKNNGIDYYQPMLILMTDGEPTDSPNEVAEAVALTTELAKNRKLSIFPISVGENANKQKLKEFSPDREPLELDGLKYTEFFTWLSASVSAVSQSSGDEKVALDTSAIASWSTI